MRKQVEAYLKDAYGKERARPNVEDGHFTFGENRIAYLIIPLILDSIISTTCDREKKKKRKRGRERKNKRKRMTKEIEKRGGGSVGIEKE